VHHGPGGRVLQAHGRGEGAALAHLDPADAHEALLQAECAVCVPRAARIAARLLRLVPVLVLVPPPHGRDAVLLPGELRRLVQERVQVRAARPDVGPSGA